MVQGGMVQGGMVQGGMVQGGMARDEMARVGVDRFKLADGGSRRSLDQKIAPLRAVKVGA